MLLWPKTRKISTLFTKKFQRKKGYAIQYKGSWADASEKSIGSQRDADYYVEVTKAPIQDFTLNMSAAGDDRLMVNVQNIAFSSEEYAASKDQVRYQYKLDDGSWSASTANATYTFEVGEAGNHTVYVKATLDGITLEKSIGYEVEERFQVTTAAGAVTNYDSFSAAVAAAQENSGSTLKCFADVNDDNVVISKGNFTIDANGKTFTGAITVESGATVTIDGNGVFKKGVSVYGTLNIKSGAFYTYWSDGQYSGVVLTGVNGTLNIFGGDFNQVDAVNNGTITGGAFRLMRVGGNVKLSGGRYKRLKVASPDGAAWMDI